MLYKLAAASMIIGSASAAGGTISLFADEDCTPAYAVPVASGGVSVLYDSYTSGNSVCSALEGSQGTFQKMTSNCEEKEIRQETCGNAGCQSLCDVVATVKYPDGMPLANGCTKGKVYVGGQDLGVQALKLEGFPESFFVCIPKPPPPPALVETPCFGDNTQATLADGQTVLMSNLMSGDYVLPGPTRVIVNQHAKAHLTGSLLNIEHTDGEISLTADHVLSVNGKFVAAREAVEGSMLGDSKVTRVASSLGGIINPLTASGKINANGILASTYPEWIASYVLSSSILPTLTLSNGISFLFPATTQAYYDALLEPFFQFTSSALVSLKTSLPAPLVAFIFVAADFTVAAGFVAFSLASVQALVVFVAIAASLKSRK